MWEQVTEMQSPMSSGGRARNSSRERHAAVSMNGHPDPRRVEGEGPAFPRKVRNSRQRWLEAAVLALAVIALMGASDDSARFKDLGHRMMCVCGCNQILLECNHVGCQSSDKMRDQLLASLDKGNNDDLILQGFVQEYGPTVIAAPTASGFNFVAWIMPFVALALGIAFVVYVVHSWKNRPTPALADGIAIPASGDLEEFRRKARKETDQ
jgi:cytochrome c-type biogenesis protein CcmH